MNVRDAIKLLREVFPEGRDFVVFADPKWLDEQCSAHGLSIHELRQKTPGITWVAGHVDETG